MLGKSYHVKDEQKAFRTKSDWLIAYGLWLMASLLYLVDQSFIREKAIFSNRDNI
jgi:hypothetical protein